MSDVTFVNFNTGGNVTVDTGDIIVVKVYSDKVRVNYNHNKIFATLASYNTNKATLLSEGVEILD